MRTCTTCGGAVAAPDEITGYAGRWCSCNRWWPNLAPPLQPKVFPDMGNALSKLKAQVLKPRLKKQGTLWFCTMLSEVGCGATPQMAYTNWKNLLRHRAMFQQGRLST